MGRRNDIDWPAIQKAFRLGQLTVRQIAKQHGVNASSISRKADKDGWVQDFTEEVRTRTNAALLSDATQSNVPTPVDIEIAVKTNVELVRQHRATLGRAHRIAEKLLDELEQSTDYRAEIEEEVVTETKGDRNQKLRAAMLRAVGLGGRASTALALSQTLKYVMPLERQAFNLDDSRPPAESVDRAVPNDPIEAARTYQRLINGAE